MKIKILFTAFALLFTVGFIACNSAGEKNATEQTTTETTEKTEPYQCPMKCEGEKVYEKAGQCPVCKMDLEKNTEHQHDDSGHQH